MSNFQIDKLVTLIECYKVWSSEFLFYNVAKVWRIGPTRGRDWPWSKKNAEIGLTKKIRTLVSISLQRTGTRRALDFFANSFYLTFQKILDCKLISFFCTRLNFVIGREESGLCQAEQDQSDHCCSNWSPRTWFFKLFWLLSPDCFQESLRIWKKGMEPEELH